MTGDMPEISEMITSLFTGQPPASKEKDKQKPVKNKKRNQ